jgi:flagellar motor switch protein FliN/FliY
VGVHEGATARLRPLPDPGVEGGPPAHYEIVRIVPGSRDAAEPLGQMVERPTVVRFADPLRDVVQERRDDAEPALQPGRELRIVGKARPQIRDLLRLQRDAVLALDRRVDDPVELYVGDRLIARGELQELDGDQAGQLAVRLTEVANLRGGL